MFTGSLYEGRGCSGGGAGGRADGREEMAEGLVPCEPVWCVVRYSGRWLCVRYSGRW